MAVIKVFSAGGVKELKCFDTLDNVEYITPDQEPFDTDPADDLMDLESE